MDAEGRASRASGMGTNRQLLRRIHSGGVVITDVTRANRAREYTNSLLDFERESAIPVPFFIACNMFETKEQFEVSIAQQFLPISTPLAISASGSNEDTLAYVNDLATDLASLGINVHFGPSLQMHTPETPNELAMDGGSPFKIRWQTSGKVLSASPVIT